jgi:glycosyltransferase involved in cell wall biosynthesis
MELVSGSEMESSSHSWSGDPRRGRPPRESHRVLFVLADMETGGVQRHAALIMAELARRGHASHIVCLSRPGPMCDHVGSDVRLTALDASSSAVALARLVRLLRRERPDILMMAALDASVVARLAASLSGVRARVVWKHNSGHLGTFGARERLVELLFRRLTDRYYAVAFGQLPYLLGYLQLPPTQVGVVRNAVPAGPPTEPLGLRADLGFGGDEFVIGILAVLRPEKDHATLLRAIADLIGWDGPNIRLVIIGDGPERPNVDRLVDDLGLARHVTLLGDRRDVKAVLAALDLVVLTSTNIECLPYAILESMEEAKPVVATAVGGLPELIEHGTTGYLTIPGDATGLARAIQAVRCSEDRGRSLGAAGRERVRRVFDLEVSVDGLERELRELVGGDGGRRRRWR